MNLFTHRTTWANWQFGLLKLAMFAIGVLVGVYFDDFWEPLLPLVWAVAIVTVIWVTVLGVRSLQQASPYR